MIFNETMIYNTYNICIVIFTRIKLSLIQHLSFIFINIHLCLITSNLMSVNTQVAFKFDT
jgi:hypothetical protein